MLVQQDLNVLILLIYVQQQPGKKKKLFLFVYKKKFTLRAIVCAASRHNSLSSIITLVCFSKRLRCKSYNS